ncbi:AI-2E family transporter [Entomospira culicis]|uniref:AI-2E family transporter n=1 Tax=Entomospira culicis TaxID=2719989 RepID=A0A968GED4_9SPIO|nr:AI-2E family transporter [Entomospira culicis]NIZ18511.1 AI-2E family transporter [Entomospira culicis]NIZ68727.1 AI-2E family transporter [Entomospira culicis]WDI37324.1 AI-2E family transporter [Entomospira culicis]WDI38953.1 AI-2E family transporter [Entomospira culicis]
MLSPSGKMPKSGSISLIVLAVLAVAYTLHFLSSVFIPIIVALLFAAFLEPIVRKMVAIKIPRILAIILAVSISLLIIALLLLIVIASLSEFFSYIANLTPRATIMINDLLESDFLTNTLAHFNIDQEAVRQTFSISALLNRFISELSTTILNFTNSGLTFFSSVFMITLFSVFFLMESHDFSSVVLHVMGSQSAKNFSDLGEEISVQIGRYLYVKTLVSIMTGVAIFIVASITGLKFAMMWGLLGFLLNYIPVIGSAVVVIGIILASILQFYSMPVPLFTNLIAMPLIQVIFGNIIDPRMQGKSLDISPSLVLISLSIWGAIWGIPGMFLSIPATVLIKIILHKFDSTRNLAKLMGLKRQEIIIETKEEPKHGN